MKIFLQHMYVFIIAVSASTDVCACAINQGLYNATVKVTSTNAEITSCESDANK